MCTNRKCISQQVIEETCSSSATLPKVGPSQVLPFLYLGSQEDAVSIKTMQEYFITHVINASVTGERAAFLCENDNEHFMRIPVQDSLTADLLSYFDQVYAFIEKARLSNGRVLIHCLAGISRSPALAVAYVMRYLNLSVDDAYRHVKNRRPHISPNFNFLGQLSQYERNLAAESEKESTLTTSAKCIKIHTPFLDCRRFVPVESSSQSNETTEQPAKMMLPPKSSDSNRCNMSTSRRLLSLTSTLASLSTDAFPKQSKLSRPSSITLKRPNSITLTRPVPKIDCSTTETNNQHSTSTRDETKLINTYFSENNSISQPKASSLLDPNTETNRSVSNPSCHLLVS